MITFILGFIAGYIWYPTFKAIRILLVMREIDRTMAEIHKEYNEIRDTLNEIDREWNEKNG